MTGNGNEGADASQPEGTPVVVPAAGATPQAPPAKRSNIASGDIELVWRDDLPASLEGLRRYVLATAQRSERWYWAHKTTKARIAVTIQWIAILATGLAGLVPIGAKLTLFAGFSDWLRRQGVAPVDSGLFASLLIGSGAALLSIDRIAGISSGWTRYVLTATAIRAAAEEFRLDWAALSAQAASPPTAEQSAAMIQRAKVFSMAIEALIAKETQDWATEFRQNMNLLERDLKVQVEQAKVDRERIEQEAKAKAEQEKAARVREAQPGSLEASVPNANTTDDFRFQAKLENNSGLVVDEIVAGSETWTQLALPAGTYKLTISGLVKKQKVSSTTVLLVKPGETTKSQLSLPAASAPSSAPPH
jgi:hypothetical protein